MCSSLAANSPLARYLPRCRAPRQLRFGSLTNIFRSTIKSEMAALSLLLYKKYNYVLINCNCLYFLYLINIILILIFIKVENQWQALVGVSVDNTSDIVEFHFLRSIQWWQRSSREAVVIRRQKWFSQTHSCFITLPLDGSNLCGFQCDDDQQV